MKNLPSKSGIEPRRGGLSAAMGSLDPDRCVRAREGWGEGERGRLGDWAMGSLDPDRSVRTTGRLGDGETRRWGDGMEQLCDWTTLNLGEVPSMLAGITGITGEPWRGSIITEKWKTKNKNYNIIV